MARLNALNEILHFHDRVLVVHGVAHGSFSCLVVYFVQASWIDRYLLDPKIAPSINPT